MPGRGTADAIFVVRQQQEKYIAANKLLHFAFIDLEKARDLVPRKVPWWASKEPLVLGIGCVCHAGQVLQCPESFVGQWSVQ